MFFGDIAIEETKGAILAHTIRVADGSLKKGTVLGSDHIQQLREAGYSTVTVARLDSGDVEENAAAMRLGTQLTGTGVRADGAFTGRVNLYATDRGLFSYDIDGLKNLNRLDDRLTVATLPNHTKIAAGQMVATVKVIPYAVDEPALKRAITLAASSVLSVASFKKARVALVLTQVSGEKPTLLEKRRRAIYDRVKALGGIMLTDSVVDHRTDALAKSLSETSGLFPDLVLVFGGAAISDEHDVVPAAVLQADGRIVRVGMPVDPGNLSMVGTLGTIPTIGIPSCAASPRLNGFDWMLERVFAGQPLDSNTIADMGGGGLLGEISERTQPRARVVADPASLRVHALVLAAGRSTRMQDGFKLLEPVAGKPIISHVVDAALESDVDGVSVVVGHRSDDVATVLGKRAVLFINNPDYTEGLSTSLRVGLNSLSPSDTGAIVLLGDMPLIKSAVINRLLEVFLSTDGRSICVPVHRGKRGNPVVWPAHLFSEMAAITGDKGARALLRQHHETVVEVECDDNSIFIDIDRREDLKSFSALVT